MDVNIRLHVLEKSLDIENELSKIIIEIIKVPKSNTKTLGNQSSSLSFKTKADLLYDLDRISLNEYNSLILFMEIRNQLIHNLNADTFTKTFEILGNSKKTKLLSINPDVKEFRDKLIKENQKVDEEKLLEFGFNFLYFQLKEAIINQGMLTLEALKNERLNEIYSKQYSVAIDALSIFQETVKEFGKVWTEQLQKQGISNEGFEELMHAFINKKSLEKLAEKYPEFKDKI